MSETQDHYKVLQISEDAETFVIEAVYRRLAREYHPDVDKSPGAHERMVRLNAAYEVLSNPEHRKNYDETRRSKSAYSERKERTNRTQQNPKSEFIPPPTAPKPEDYDLEPDYLERARAAAAVWRSLPNEYLFWQLLWVVPAAITLFLILFDSQATGLRSPVPVAECLVIVGMLVAIESVIVFHRNRKRVALLDDYFIPRFNPKSENFRAYASAQADHDRALRTVYVTASGTKIHSHQFCGNSYQMIALKMYEASQKGYTPCSKCGWFPSHPVDLPPPFGSGNSVFEINELYLQIKKEVHSSLRVKESRNFWNRPVLDIVIDLMHSAFNSPIAVLLILLMLLLAIFSAVVFLPPQTQIPR